MGVATEAANGCAGTLVVNNKRPGDTITPCIYDECSTAVLSTVDTTTDSASTCTLNTRETFTVRNTFVHVDSDADSDVGRARKPRSSTYPAGFISLSLFMDIVSDIDSLDSSADSSDVDLDTEFCICKDKTMDAFDSPDNRSIQAATTYESALYNLDSSDESSELDLDADFCICKDTTMDAFDSPGNRTIEVAATFDQEHVGIRKSSSTPYINTQDAFDTPANLAAHEAARAQENEVSPSVGGQQDGCGHMETIRSSAVSVKNGSVCAAEHGGCSTAANREMTMLTAVALPMILMRPVALIPVSLAVECTRPSSSSCDMIAAHTVTQAAMAAQIVNEDHALDQSKRKSARPNANARRKAKAKANQRQQAGLHSAHESAELIAGELESNGQTSEKATTVVLRNLPLNYRRNMLLEILDQEGFAGDYNFVYLPIDLSTGSGLGFTFVNLVTPDVVPRFWQALDGYNRWMFPSAKVLKVNWSPHQGLEAHVKHFRNSPLMHHSVKDEYRPITLAAGHRVPFPLPTRTLWAPKFKKMSE